MKSVVLPLMPTELSNVHSPSISTLTFFNTTAPVSDTNQTRTFLQSRVDAIVQVNPWLSGQIQTNALGGNRLVLRYDANTSSLPVEIISMPALSPSLEYEAVAGMLSSLEAPQGSDVVDVVHAALFRVYWITISSSQSALFVSMAHGLGDGYTYYRIYGMLSADARVEALLPDRVDDFQRVRAAAISDIDNVLSMLGRAARQESTKDERSRRTLHTIDPAWIANEKAKASRMVSTNDILTSWFFRQTKADIGVMVVNLRGRAEGLEPHMAGNYQTVVAYQPEDFATPGLIRESVRHGMRRACSKELPHDVRTVSLTTSWASLYKQVVLPAWKMAEHWPITNGRSMFSNGAVIFQRTPDSIGVLMRTKHDVAKQSTLFLP
ncbi:hypothetical protein LEN26_014629 [Aphanomyces euteiches]|nr:hypothetical protein LEN26_014629 [Aphanomyces euteiches]KAH9108176.1 hypothetical protein AeMF1_016613 [Aphanomyces euteiches]KAH9183105.1 hypothetical protein AeNC1_014916 [Aphanomyces euteiches]